MPVQKINLTVFGDWIFCTNILNIKFWNANITSTCVS